ncbi:MAG: hypothetical protein NVS2B9_11950 [Myxococcales bacterium]
MPIPSAVERVILERLGAKAEPFSAEAAGRVHPGFHAPATLASPESVAADASRFRALDTRLFLGLGGTRLYAIWQLPPLDIVELARVGTHNSAPEAWREVRALVAGIAEPFDVVFADEAGLDLWFGQRISQARARAYDKMLLDRIQAGERRWIDSYAHMVDAAGRLGIAPDDGADARGGGAVASLIAAGRLRLWWD